MEFRPILSAMMRSKTGVILIALQIALTLAILTNAGYVVIDRVDQSLRDSGVDEPHTAMISVYNYTRDGDYIAQQNRDRELLRGIVGVERAEWVNQMPLSNSGSNTGLSIDRKQQDTTTSGAYYQSSGSLVDLFRLNLIEGRDFLPTDHQTFDPNTQSELPDVVTIMSLALARKMFPDAKQYTDKTIYLGTGEDAQPLRVVGVVEQLVTPWGRASWSPSDPEGNQTFLVPLQESGDAGIYALRIKDPKQADSILAEAEKRLLAAQPGRMITNKFTMEEIRKDRYRDDYFLVGLLLTVILLLILMTSAGIIGLASLWVNQRRKQIGVRRALGARRIDILRYFVLENLMMSSIGAALGVGLAIGLNVMLKQQLDMQRLPIAYLLVGVISVLLLGALAVLYPAMKAASIPPAEATRSV